MGTFSFQIISNVFRQGMVVYLLLFLAFQHLVDYERLKVKALNQLRPNSVNYLRHFLYTDDRQSIVDPIKLRENLYYYSKVVEFMPGNPDAMGIMGFCYYYLREQDKAI